MQNNEYLQSKLSDVEHGAVAFKVLAWVFALLGVVLGGVAAITISALLGSDLALTDVAVKSLGPVLNCVSCFMLFWFLQRTGLIFFSVAALIREMREVV